MGTTKLNIGKIPISKGEYQEGTAYQRLNQVTMLGSTYQSKIDDNTSAPAQMGADGAVENINTDKWLCIAVGNVSAARKVVYNNDTSGLEAGNVQEAIDETNTKVSDLSEKAGYYAQISNWSYIVADKNKRILGGFLSDGSFEFLKGIPSPIKKELKKKVDAKDGFCLIEKEVADSIQYKNNSYLYAICDALTRLLFYFDKNANCHCSKDLSVGGIFNASGLSENLINYIKERTVDESYPIFVSGENDAAYTIVGKGSDGAKNNMNVSVGYQNLRYNTGTKNVAIGNQNLMFNSANGVVAIGYHSLFRNTTGYDNCCVGAESCDDNITGYSNTAFGNYSLQRNNKGSENTAIGRYAMNGNERDEEGRPGSAFDKNNGNLSCNRNTAVGCEALFNIRSGGKNIAIGYQASMNLVDYFNTIVIGNEVSPTDNNQIIIGTSQHQEVRIAGKKILFSEDGTVKWVE